LTGEARKLWKTIGGRLIDQGLLTELDLDLLESMCEIQAMLYDARAQTKKFGSVLVSDQGGFYQNPHVAMCRCGRPQPP
jgi:P27 family predicted phage terminase small subunit